MRFATFLRPRSLAAQLLCTYVTALLLTMTTLGVLWLSSRQGAGLGAQEQLHTLASLIRKTIRFDADGSSRIGLPLDSERLWVLRDFPGDVQYRVLDASGHVLLSSNGELTPITPARRTLGSVTGSFTPSAPAGDALLVRTERMRHGRHTYYIQVAVRRRLTRLVTTLSGRIWVSDTLKLGLASLMLVIVAVYFTLRRVLRPLRETSAAAAKIDPRHLSNRLSTQDLPTEFLPVVRAFNLTLDRLEKGYVVQRAFLADAAHELKTPLTLFRAQIDMAGAADCRALLQDIDRMARQVNQLLHLAEASETQNYVFELVDLAELAEDVNNYLRPLAERHQVYVQISRAAGTAPVEADRGALFMFLRNLIENAIQHSPRGGTVAVRIAADHLSVCDEGPGIAADELPKVFNRFWRGPARRNDGAGLGLSICAEIAAAHKWDLRAQSNGQGAQFTAFFTSPGAVTVAAA